jgi:hypothetical protein
MFYREDDIAYKLICPRCNVKFVDSRIIVPCHETLCVNCIEDLTEAETSEINCHFCRVKHQIPAAGFGTNKIMIHLLGLKADEVYRSANVEAVKEKLSRIQQLKDQLKTNIETSELIINEHCRGVKIQIDLVVETKMKELNDMRDEYLAVVNAYERDCLNNLPNLDTQVLFRAVDKANQFVNELKDYLKSFRIDENVVSTQSVACDRHLAELEGSLLYLKGSQFRGQVIKFKPNELKIESIGAFEYDTIEMPMYLNTKNLSKSRFLLSQNFT